MDEALFSLRPPEPPPPDRSQTHHEAEEPDDADHALDGVLRPGLEVVDGAGDGPVAVQGDEADVEDGGGAQEHVQR